MDEGLLLDVEESIITGVFDGEKLISASKSPVYQNPGKASNYVNAPSFVHENAHVTTGIESNPYTNPYCDNQSSQIGPGFSPYKSKNQANNQHDSRYGYGEYSPNFDSYLQGSNLNAPQPSDSFFHGQQQAESRDQDLYKDEFLSGLLPGNET